MANNVWRELGEGTAQHTKTKNIAAAKVSGQLISFPAVAQANANKVALLTKDAASGEDDVPCLIGGVIVRYACVTTDTTVPGTTLYFDLPNDRLTTTATGFDTAGRAAATKGSGPAFVELILNG